MNRTMNLVFFLSFLLVGNVHSWSFVMVEDHNLVKTADVIVEGEIVSKGPGLYSGMPATEYTVNIFLSLS